MQPATTLTDFYCSSSTTGEVTDRDIYASVKQEESRVAKAGTNVPTYKGTTVRGEGVWWEKTENGYHFFDGDEDLESHSEGPSLLHHRSVLLEEVGKQQRAV